MQIDYDFLASALTLISNSALQQVGRVAIDNSLKAVQPFVQGIWAFVQNKSQEETVAELKSNAAIKGLVEELTKLIEANPEFKAALKEAIDLSKNQQVGLEDVTADNQFKAEIEQKAQGNSVNQVGATKIQVKDGATFVIKQTIN